MADLIGLIKDRLAGALGRRPDANVGLDDQAVSRRDRAITDVSRAGRDAAFNGLSAEGDAASRRQEWGIAADKYAAALEHYPAHGALRVQYAHMLKELWRYEEAELAYRDAIADGAAPLDVIEHLGFVALRSGWGGDIYPCPVLDALVSTPHGGGVGRTAFSLGLLTSTEAAALGAVFLQEGTYAPHSLLPRLRRAPRLDEFVALLIAEDGFVVRNMGLLTALAGKTASGDTS